MSYIQALGRNPITKYGTYLSKQVTEQSQRKLLQYCYFWLWLFWCMCDFFSFLDLRSGSVNRSVAERPF